MSFKYSILTTAYKSDKYLKKYFNSIIRQTIYPNEIVIVDDTNNNKLIKFVRNIKKKYNLKIKVIKNKVNIGPCKSLNKGIKSIKNNLIIRLDVDDEWRRDHVENLRNLYENDKSFLIYAYSLKNEGIKNWIKCDDFFINENSTIHSSWMINRNINKNFIYLLEDPVIAMEDYYTLMGSILLGYKIKIHYNKTIKYNINLDSHGNKYKNSIVDTNYKKIIARKLFNYNYKVFREKIKLSRNFFSYLLFVKKFKLIKYLVYVFWTLDLLKIKKLFN